MEQHEEKASTLSYAGKQAKQWESIGQHGFALLYHTFMPSSLADLLTGHGCRRHAGSIHS